MNIPKFTDDQIEYLNKVFSENTVMTLDHNELYRRLGNRQVIQHIIQCNENAKRKITS